MSMPTPSPVFLARRQVLKAGLALGALSVGGGAVAQDRPLVIASKLDTEGALLGHMIAGVMARRGVATQLRLQLGPTRIVRQALLAGEIDIYPEYTGNGAFFHQRETDPAWRAPQSAFDTVRALDAERHQLVWLERAPANNTWAIAVRGDLARGAGLATLEDVARHVAAGRPFKLAGSAEFFESPAAFPAFEAAYGLKLAADRRLVLAGGDTAVTMRAAAEQLNGVNAAMVYGTDGAIGVLGLVVMQDPKGAQIVYEPAPVIRRAALDRTPRIAEWLAPVFRSLDQPTLIRLNGLAVVEGRAPRDVAEAHLAALGL
jgi:osmoprotectant transport system substrate-binding protein